MTARKVTGGRFRMIAIGCAWKGCEEEYRFPGGTDDTTEMHNEGWRLLVLAQNSPFKRGFVINADIAGHICPEHCKELLGYLGSGEELQNAKKGRKAYEYQKYLYEKFRDKED